MTPPVSDVGRKPSARNVVLEIPDEAPPFACNLAAAAFSFVIIAALEFVSSLYIISFSSTLENAWILLTDLLPSGPLVNASLGAMVLTVIGIALQFLQRFRRFPSWLPLVLAWPAAWLMVAPSAFVHSDDWAPWLIVGAMAAFVFCCHWLCILLAKEAWD